MSRRIPGRTEDGIRLATIVKMAKEIDGVGVREGTKHPVILQADGFSRPCPVSTSTNAQRMIVPWLKEVIGYSYSQHEIYSALSQHEIYSALSQHEIYSALKAGTWYYR